VSAPPLAVVLLHSGWSSAPPSGIGLRLVVVVLAVPGVSRKRRPLPFSRFSFPCARVRSCWVTTPPGVSPAPGPGPYCVVALLAGLSSATAEFGLSPPRGSCAPFSPLGFVRPQKVTAVFDFDSVFDFDFGLLLLFHHRPELLEQRISQIERAQVFGLLSKGGQL
jgi:hypothetical protein